MIKKSAVILVFIMMSPRITFGMNLEDYISTVNIKGLAGYYFVDSTKSLPAGQIQASIFGTDINNDDAGFKTESVEAVLSAGILDDFETSLVVPYVHTSGVGPPTLGDIKAAGKYHLLNQVDDDALALATAFSLVFPTGNKNKGFRTVNSLGGDLLLIADTKLNLADYDLADYAFYLTAEGGLYIQDPGQDSSEKHIRYGGAGLFPIEPLELLIEAVGTVKKGTGDQDTVAFSASLRYVQQRFQITGGLEKTIPVGVSSKRGTGVHVSASLIF